MSYCTVDHVKGEFRSLEITDDSIVKESDLVEFIEEADAEINAIIGLKYVVPVTSGNALILCRKMSRAIAADRVAGKLEFKTGETKAEQNAGKMSREDAIKLAREIADGKIVFDGASLISAADGVQSASNPPECDERVFKRNVEQW